jgi:hypothetical protein
MIAGECLLCKKDMSACTLLHPCEYPEIIYDLFLVDDITRSLDG